jgi:hypothetical protein
MVSTCAPNRDCEIVTQATQVHAERSGSISSFLCSEPRFFTRCMPVELCGSTSMGPHPAGHHNNRVRKCAAGDEGHEAQGVNFSQRARPPRLPQGVQRECRLGEWRS